MAVALSLQSYLGCNQAATHPLTHSDKTSSFTGRRHQICSPSARLIVQLCNTPIMSHARQRKTDISCTHSARLAYGCLLSQPPNISFTCPSILPFSFLPDISLLLLLFLLTPQFFNTLLKFPDWVYPVICHHSAFIPPPSSIKLKEAEDFGIYAIVHFSISFLSILYILSKILLAI